MFWGTFLYNYKESYYYWYLEIIKEKRISKDLIKDLNKRLELTTKKE